MQNMIEKSGVLKNKNLLSHIKMVKETFGDIEIEKIHFTVIKVLLF